MTTPQMRGSDRGSATVLMVAIIALVLVLALGLAALARSSHAQARAQGVADLAALAGARAQTDTGASPCPVAAAVVAEHGAHLRACTPESLTVLIEVSIAVESFPGRPARAHAAARAGPVGLPIPGEP